MKKYVHTFLYLMIITAGFTGSHLVADEQVVEAQTESAAQEQEVKQGPTISIESHPEGGVIIDNVGVYQFVGTNAVLVGAPEEGYGSSALASINLGLHIINSRPIAHKDVEVNGSKNQPNPLWDKQIRHLLVGGDCLFAVTEDRPGTLYCYRYYNNKDNAKLYVQKLADEFGKPCTIEQLWYGVSSQGGGYVFASVISHKDNEQQGGCALAVIKVFTEIVTKKKKDKEGKEVEEKKSTFYFKGIDATTGKFGNCKALSVESLSSIANLDFLKTPTTAPKVSLDTVSTITHQITDTTVTGTSKAPIATKPVVQPALINQGAEVISINDIQWDGQLYIGLTVRPKSALLGSSTAHALLVGRLIRDAESKTEMFSFETFAPDEVCAGNQSIIGCTGSSNIATVHTYRPMRTSTQLSYSIILGGVGAADHTARCVYALPRVNNRYLAGLQQKKSKANGTLASLNAGPQLHTNGRTDHILGRAFEQKALQFKDAPQCTHKATCVGGDALLPGPVADMWVVGDAVFVAVAAADAHKAPGVFYSQAILDGQGEIAAWTGWQRVVGTAKAVLNIVPTGVGGFSMISPCGEDNEKIRFFQSGWFGGKDEGLVNPSQGLQILFRKLFPQEVAGIQGLFDVAQTASGISGSEPVSLLIATGYQRVLLAQTSQLTDDGSRWYTGAYEDTLICDDGTFANLGKAKKSPQALICSGGALDDLGPITCAHVASNGTDAWFCVGGSRGVAVVALPNGSGWSAKQGIGNCFKNFKSDMVFKQIGSYAFVRKIMSDDQYLYVLTDDVLARIPLQSSTFADGAQEQKFMLATSHDMADAFEAYVFTDACVSQGTALLATSNGLLATGPHVDVRSIKRESEPSWYRVELPAVCDYITGLVPVSVTGKEADAASGGQLYVLASSLHDNKASITRLYVDIASKAQPLSLVPDYYKKDQPSPWVLFSSALAGFATDGAHHLITRSQHGTLPTNVALMNGARQGVVSGWGSALPLALQSVQSINSVVRSSVSGSLWIATDDGVRIHE